MKLIDLIKSYVLTEYAENPCHKLCVYCRGVAGMPKYLYEDIIPPKDWERYIHIHRLEDKKVIRWGFGCHTHIGFEIIQANDVELSLWVEVE